MARTGNSLLLRTPSSFTRIPDNFSVSISKEHARGSTLHFSRGKHLPNGGVQGLSHLSLPHQRPQACSRRCRSCGQSRAHSQSPLSYRDSYGVLQASQISHLQAFEISLLMRWSFPITMHISHSTAHGSIIGGLYDTTRPLTIEALRVLLPSDIADDPAQQTSIASSPD